ncbi:MAG: response regulator [Moraxella sp.]|jgi:twitching motility two-component system response regulator PilH|uniref:Response regulator n=1 Tax=Faucicola osloensis TaxID=34062 RepID=A0A0X8K6G7_FAUOS|nr:MULTISPECIES: response regulator [Pseudomonadota]NOX78617.1 response regulator [Gammaproteobacteria bacterium]RVU82655.1 response regulator [Leucothrix sargassi]TGP48775.1 response regulator [bacterium M00.F.Ca.ET.230.01.1.1]VWX30277.1 twitching motility protein [Moraxellaceae bacterium 17A]HBI48406.1 response regulator [Moraxellaceae bacterium]
MAKILVVDDSPSEMAKFRDILTRHQYEVIEAHTGDDGIQKANEFFPDVILMDVVMPEMNGFQATRKLTRDPKTSHIPVVIISTKNQETDRVWGKRQGARDYLSKPITEEALITVIRSVME